MLALRPECYQRVKKTENNIQALSNSWTKARGNFQTGLRQAGLLASPQHKCAMWRASLPHKSHVSLSPATEPCADSEELKQPNHQVLRDLQYLFELLLDTASLGRGQLQRECCPVDTFSKSYMLA